MNPRSPISLLLLCTVSFACGRAGEPPKAATDSPGAAPAVASQATTDVVSRCAGFTPATAAAIIGVPAADITDYSRTEGKLRMCHYGAAGERSKSVSFTLRRAPSVESASASMASERETMGSAQTAIDRVTGSASKKPAVEDVSAIGDEAFYSPMNGAIMLRVRDVIAQVTAPADLTLKKRAAEQVAQALRH
jgi:hypothetical protein